MGRVVGRHSPSPTNSCHPSQVRGAGAGFSPDPVTPYTHSNDCLMLQNDGLISSLLGVNCLNDQSKKIKITFISAFPPAVGTTAALIEQAGISLQSNSRCDLLTINFMLLIRIFFNNAHSNLKQWNQWFIFWIWLADPHVQVYWISYCISKSLYDMTFSIENNFQTSMKSEVVAWLSLEQWRLINSQ